MISAVLLAAAVVITPQSEIVVATNAPYATRLAAQELNFFLRGVLGNELPVVASHHANSTAIVLGNADGAERRPYHGAANCGSSDRDGFAITATNGVVWIHGNDDDVPGGDISKTCWYGEEAPWQPHFRRGTLFGVYEFLERHAGVRMYFPGELGTVIPAADRIAVPEGRIEKAPAFRFRRYGFKDGPESDDFKLLNWYRLRMETETMKCVHGHRRLKIYARFGKTHPEYFANHGNPYVRESVRARGHLCHSSRVWEEIEKDAMKFFAEGGRDTFDLMPEDGLTPRFRCMCAKCAAAYTSDRHYATALVWRPTAQVAAHVKAKFPHARFTQMAYNPYGGVPDFDLPDNLDVTVARRGPWSLAFPALERTESAEIREWAAKLGRPVTLWTYPGKWRRAVLCLPDIPQLAPRAWGRYFSSLADVINGAFAESESDRWSYNYLNYYVFSRVCWDPAIDVEAVLAEHHRLMFGPAAEPMGAFHDLLERKWMACAASGFAELIMDGGLTTTHSARTAVPRIYTPEVIAQLDSLIATARARTGEGSLPRRRIDWLETEYLVPLKKTCK